MRKPRRSAVSGLPGWLVRFIETGEIPQDGTEDARQFLNWQLLPGWPAFMGLQWPDPSVREPERLPRA